MLDELERDQEVFEMWDWYINAGRAIAKLMRIADAHFSKAECRVLMLAGQSLAAMLRSERKALARSRRNNETVKRCAHGRTQRTRGRK